jgi:PHP family Zn ribbon phosphoesterase
MAPAIRRYRADLHVHTALSPCGSETMTPPAIVAAAIDRGVDLIGAVDHNAAANARSLVEAAAAATDGVLHVLPGLEVQSGEGVHVVCFYDTVEAAESMQELVWSHLPDGPGRRDLIERQWLLDASGNRIGLADKPLWEPTRLSLADICRDGRRRGSLVIAAHVTRPVTGLFPILGAVPDGLPIDALEMGPSLPPDERAQADLARHPHVAASDAHQPDDVGSACTDFWLAGPTVAELRLALQGMSGRRAAMVAGEDT